MGAKTSGLSDVREAAGPRSLGRLLGLFDALARSAGGLTLAELNAALDSQNQNAASLMPVHVEPYLIKVMQKAKELLGSEHAALKADIDLFIRQESQHYKQHQQFNKALYAAGYDRLPEFERELADDYRRFLAQRSLRFNCAYCEGFGRRAPA